MKQTRQSQSLAAAQVRGASGTALPAAHPSLDEAADGPGDEEGDNHANVGRDGGPLGRHLLPQTLEDVGQAAHRAMR